MRGTAGEWSRSAEKRITLVPPTRRLRQKDCHEFLASMGYRARPYLKTQNKAVEWKGKDKLRDIGVMSEPASEANWGFYLKCHEQLFVSVCMCVRVHVHGVCVYVCVCVSGPLYVSAYSCMHTCVWKPRDDIGCCPRMLFTIFTETESLAESRVVPGTLPSVF